jgi:GntR family transcriptional regulator
MISKESNAPLYMQLYAAIRERIQTGEYAPGQAIPAESEFIANHGVSRITVRAAVDLLVQEGWVVRQRGRGTFVKSTDPEERNCMVSFTDQTIATGHVPSARLVGLEVRQAGEFGAQLPFPPTQEVVLIERVRLVDDRSVGLVRSYIPHRHVPGIAKRHFKGHGREQSLLYVLEHTFGIVLDKGEETIQTYCVTADEASLLDIQDGAPVLLKSCFIKNALGEPLLYEEAYWTAPQSNQVQRRRVGLGPLEG